MSFIAKNPLLLPEVEHTPSPLPGTRGLVAKKDGWYEVSSDGAEERLARVKDINNTGGGGGGSDYDDSEIREALETKVDKEDGKGLSSNDFTDSEKQKLANLENYDDSELFGKINGLTENKADKTELENKVDKELGKGLSSNDFTNQMYDMVLSSMKYGGSITEEEFENRIGEGNVLKLPDSFAIGDGATYSDYVKVYFAETVDRIIQNLNDYVANKVDKVA